MPLTMIVTNAGRAALVNAQNTGTAPVAITQIGLSSAAVTPLATATALAGEFKRVSALSGTVTAADTIHVTMTDESSDAYSLRAIGLYLDNGVLFAVYGQAAAILDKAAASIAALSVDVIFADIAATSLTFGNANFVNPAATTERQGVVELATTAEAQAGIDALRALTPAGAKAAILGWLLAQDGSGSGLDADMLDGQDGSYYANIPGRLGYTPLNRAGDTMTGALTLSGAPSANLHPATKQYVDALVTSAALIAKLLTADGSGSGLDADQLDGQDSSYYVNIPARLGYTPVNKAGDTMTGPLTAPMIMVGGDLLISRTDIPYGYITRSNIPGYKRIAIAAEGGGPLEHIVLETDALTKQGNTIWHAGNDGAGSGLDADQLDGQDGSYYVNIPARLGYTPANRAGDTFSGPIRSKGSSGSVEVESTASGRTARWVMQEDGNFVLYVKQGGNDVAICNVMGQSSVNFNFPLTRGGALVWDTFNDGSGSGLDADLLDGFDSSAFLRVVAASLSPNGYIKLANGLHLMWGATAFPGGGANTTIYYSSSVSYDIALTSFSVAVVSGGNGGNIDHNPMIVTACSALGFTVNNRSDGTNMGYWIAIGV